VDDADGEGVREQGRAIDHLRFFGLGFRVQGLGVGFRVQDSW